MANGMLRFSVDDGTASLSLPPSRKLDVIYSQNTPTLSLSASLCRWVAGISPNGNLRAAFSSLSSDLWPRMAEATDPTELGDGEREREERGPGETLLLFLFLRLQCASPIPVSGCEDNRRAFRAKYSSRLSRRRGRSFLALTVIIAISLPPPPPPPRVIYLTIL